MMMFMLCALSLGLVWLTVAVPVACAVRRREDRKFQEAYRMLQSAAIRRYHPVFSHDSELASLPIREIRERFAVSDIYHQIH